MSRHLDLLLASGRVAAPDGFIGEITDATNPQAIRVRVTDALGLMGDLLSVRPFIASYPADTLLPLNALLPYRIDGG